MGSGQAAIALKTARKALRLSKDHPGHEAAWFLRLATSLRRLGRFDEASRAVERGRLHGLSDLDVLRAGYETALARNNLADAMNALDSYIRLDFNEQGVGGFLNGRLGWAEAERLRLLIKIGRSDEAVSFLEKMQLDAEGWGQAAWNLVLTDSGVQSDTLALQAADQALSLDAANHAGLFTRAEALGSLGREPEAVQAWVALRDAHPEDHTAYEKLALRLALSGDLPQALQFADRSIALGAFCPFSWAARGVVHFFGGHSEEALADLQLAWNRADVQQRRKNQVFWRLLSMLWMRQRGSRPGELMSLENQAEADGLRPFDVRLLKGIQTKISIHNRKQN
jgi:tetratricopeptide (TPR) repeat protein